MNTLKRKYSCENAIVAGDMTGGVSLEKLITKLSDDGDLPQQSSNRGNGGGRGLTRSISMVAPHCDSRVLSRGRSSTALFPGGFRGLRRQRKKDDKLPSFDQQAEDGNRHRKNASADNLISSGPYNSGGLSNGSLADTSCQGRSAPDVAQSLLHIPGGPEAIAAAYQDSIATMTRPRSTTNVTAFHHTTHAAGGAMVKPLGTLQRLARSSSNLISRSKSCLTLESLQRFRKTFAVRSEKNDASLPTKRAMTNAADLESNLSQEKMDKLTSRSSSLISVDFEHSDNITDRLNSPFEEAVTSSSNLSISSASRADAADPATALPKVSENVISYSRNDVGITNGRRPLCDAASISARSTSTFTSTPTKAAPVKPGAPIAQRSKSFHLESANKRAVRRNPSMLYYFNKSPLLSELKKDCHANETAHSLSSDVDFENSRNTSCNDKLNCEEGSHFSTLSKKRIFYQDNERRSDQSNASSLSWTNKNTLPASTLHSSHLQDAVSANMSASQLDYATSNIVGMQALSNLGATTLKSSNSYGISDRFRVDSVQPSGIGTSISSDSCFPSSAAHHVGDTALPAPSLCPSTSGLEVAQFHGPEFVVRSRQPPTELALVSEVGSNQRKSSRAVLVVLVTGQRLLLYCSPSTACIAHLLQSVSGECGVPAPLLPVFGLALLRGGEFLFPPHHTKLAKIAPKGWKNKKASREGACDPLTLHYRLAYYHKGVESHSRALCWLSYLQLRQDMLQGRLLTASHQQLLYMAALALRAEMPDWLPLYQDAGHLLLKYYLPESLFLKLGPESLSDDEDEQAGDDVLPVLVTASSRSPTSLPGNIALLRDGDKVALSFPSSFHPVESHHPSSLPFDVITVPNNEPLNSPSSANLSSSRSETLFNSHEPPSMVAVDGTDGRLPCGAACDATAPEDKVLGREVLRVLVSYEGKLRTVSVWGAVKRFIGTAQHTPHYGAHYYALQQHAQCSASLRFLGVSCDGLLLLPGPPCASSVQHATLHPWTSLKTIRRWSDGRVRVVVQCERCGKDEGGAARRGLRSCIGGLSAQGGHSATHKIILRTGSGLRSKCLVHLIKAHKKLSQEPATLSASASTPQFDASALDSTLSSSGSHASLTTLSVPPSLVSLPAPLLSLGYSEVASSSGFPSRLNHSLASSSCEMTLPNLPVSSTTSLTHIPPEHHSKGELNPPNLAPGDYWNGNNVLASVLTTRADAVDEESTISSFRGSHSAAPLSISSGVSSVRHTEESGRTLSFKSILSPIKTPSLLSLSRESITGDDPRLNPSLCTTPSFKSDFAKRLSASSSDLVCDSEDPGRRRPKPKALNFSDIFAAPSKMSVLENSDLMKYSCGDNAAETIDGSSTTSFISGDRNLSNGVARISDVDGPSASSLSSSAEQRIMSSNDLVDALSKHFDLSKMRSSMQRVPNGAPMSSSLGPSEDEVSMYTTGLLSSFKCAGTREPASPSGDLPDVLLSSCLKFSEICSNLVETSNQKLKQVLSDDPDFADATFSFNSSFDKMFEAVVEDECDVIENKDAADFSILPQEADEDDVLVKDDRMVKFDLKSDDLKIEDYDVDENQLLPDGMKGGAMKCMLRELSTKPLGDFLSKKKFQPNEEQEHKVTSEVKSRGKGKVCVDEMDVDYFLGGESDVDSAGELHKKQQESTQVEKWKKINKEFESEGRDFISDFTFRKASFEAIPEDEEVNTSVSDASSGTSGDQATLAQPPIMCRPTTQPLFSDISKKEFSLHSPRRATGNKLLARRCVGRDTPPSSETFSSKSSTLVSALKLSPFQPSPLGSSSNRSNPTESVPLLRNNLNSSFSSFNELFDELSTDLPNSVKNRVNIQNLELRTISPTSLCHSSSIADSIARHHLCSSVTSDARRSNASPSTNLSSDAAPLRPSSVANGDKVDKFISLKFPLLRPFLVSPNGNTTNTAAQSTISSSAACCRLLSPTGSSISRVEDPHLCSSSSYDSLSRCNHQLSDNTNNKCNNIEFINIIERSKSSPLQPMPSSRVHPLFGAGSSPSSQFNEVSKAPVGMAYPLAASPASTRIQSNSLARAEAPSGVCSTPNKSVGDIGYPGFYSGFPHSPSSSRPSHSTAGRLDGVVVTPANSPGSVSSALPPFVSGSPIVVRRSGRACQSPVQQRLGITSICGSPLHTPLCGGNGRAALSRSLPSSPHKSVSPSVRMGTRLPPGAVSRNRQRSEERLLRATPATAGGCHSSGGSLDSLSEEGATHDASWGSSSSQLGDGDGCPGGSPGTVLVPVVVVRGTGGSLGVVVVQGGGEDSDPDEQDGGVERRASDRSVTQTYSGHGHLPSRRLNNLDGDDGITSAVLADHDDANEDEQLPSSGLSEALLEEEEDDDGIFERGGSSLGGREKSCVVVQTVLEGGPAYNKLIPGDQLVWVNGHNLEELPYRASVDLLRDSTSDVLSFVIVRQHSDHQLLLERQSGYSSLSPDCNEGGICGDETPLRPHRFPNEQSPTEYYADMRQQQLKKASRERQDSSSDEGGPNRRGGLRVAKVIPDAVGGSSFYRYTDRQKDSSRVQLQVEYSGPPTVITIPIQKEEGVATSKEQKTTVTITDVVEGMSPTRTKMEIPINKGGEGLPPKYISSKTLKLKRSESKGEISSPKTGAPGGRSGTGIQRSHTFCSGRGLRNDVRSGLVTCVTLNIDDGESAPPSPGSARGVTHS